MRAKALYPLLFSGLFLLLTMPLLLWGSPSTYGGVINPAWTDLGGPRAGPARASARRRRRRHAQPAGLDRRRLYLAIYFREAAAPYLRHDQLWTSTDGGRIWTQLTAPDLPIHFIAAGLITAAEGEALYLSTFDSDEFDDQAIPADLYISRNAGATWQNLGAIPNGAAALATSATADTLWAGNRGAWQFAASAAPTATPTLTPGPTPRAQMWLPYVETDRSR